MRTASLLGGPLVTLLIGPVVATAFGQTSNLPPRSKVSGPQERLAALVKAHQDARGRFFEEYRARADVGEGNRAIGRYRVEIDRTAREAMVLARTHAQEPVAIDALRFVVKAGQARQMKPTAAYVVEALEILRSHHVRAAKMGEFCEYLVLNPLDPVAEALIREVLEQHPSHDERGLACHALAGLRKEQANLIRWLQGRPEDRRPYEEEFGDALKSFENAWGKEFIARFLKNDPTILEAEANALLERVVTEFGAVPHAFGTKQKTLADLAKAELFERRGLAIDKTAPEIMGRDHEGKAFRLSDFRGRVVLLTFSGNWCGPCRAMYSKERELVARFKDKPFSLLSVNTDEKVETLRKSIETGEITWRCWWDGRTGPITERWGVIQFPAIFLLDEDGVIRAKPNHQSESLAKLVEDLLDECKAKSKP